MPTQRDEHSAARGFGAGYGIVAAGFQLAFSILFFLGMGYLADRRLGTRPVLMLVGLALGLAAGLYAFIRRVQAAAGPGRPPRPAGRG
jgi:F0F1-type ATP synthase assembly protein I